ncbi:Protein NRT1/ PTR FAMILY 5.8 [Linum perenne]
MGLEKRACCLLIVIAGMERFAFKGVASNLVTYLTDVVKMSNSSAAKTVNNWCGFTFLLPLLVASLSDSYCGRSSTILASCFLYILVGLGALTSTAMNWGRSPSKNIQYSLLFGSLCLISFGQGGYNPSLQAFGAEQLECEDENLPCTNEDKKCNLKSLLFQWWYFGVCAGSLLGVMVMSYIQDTIGWVLGFAIPTLAMVASMALFFLGTNIFRYKQDQDSISKNHFLTIFRLFICRITSSSHKPVVAELELQEQPLFGGQKSNNVNTEEETSTKFLKNAKTVMRLLPIWAVLLIFAVIFQQPTTFFTNQGMTMERSIGTGSTKFMIPPATLQSSITISIILLMPLYDRILIPMSRFVTRSEKGISVMQRMGIGMFLSVIAMIIAALVEEKRLYISRDQTDGSSNVPMKIFWLLPQYILLGISDIFTVVGMQEFFYGEVPVKLRTLGIALYTSVFGVGSFMSSMLICLVELFASWRKDKSWFSDDMREARLDKYYWLLAILSSVTLVLYVILCQFYRGKSDYQQVVHDDVDHHPPETTCTL